MPAGLEAQVGALDWPSEPATATLPYACPRSQKSKGQHAATSCSSSSAAPRQKAARLPRPCASFEDLAVWAPSTEHDLKWAMAKAD